MEKHIRSYLSTQSKEPSIKLLKDKFSKSSGFQLIDWNQYSLKLSSVDDSGLIRIYSKDTLSDVPYTVKIYEKDSLKYLKVELESASTCNREDIKCKKFSGCVRKKWK